MRYDNTLACMSWLEYLNLQGKQQLLGVLNQNVLEAAKFYDIGYPYLSYIAEFPLLGKPGIDLSGVYSLSWMKEQNIFYQHPATADGEQLQQYAQALSEVNPELVQSSSFFLEIDSSKEKPSSYGLFISLAGKYVPLLLPKALEAQKLEYCLPTVEKLLQAAAPHMGLWYVGFMHSRTNEPLRLSLVTHNDGLHDIILTAKAMGLNTFSQAAEPIVEQLEKMHLFTSAYLSLDILKDGSIGNVVGLDLHPGSFNPNEQKIYLSESYDEFYSLMKKLGIADERLDYIKECVFSNQLQGFDVGECELNSFLSHFKLKWRGTELLPLKAYLQMKVFPKQRTLNNIFNI